MMTGWLMWRATLTVTSETRHRWQELRRENAIAEGSLLTCEQGS